MVYANSHYILQNHDRNLYSCLRRIVKNRFTTVINKVGLTAGVFVTLALINFYHQERSYDHYHRNADRIYKAITQVQFNNGTANTFPISFGVLGKHLESNFEAVSKSARTYGPYRVEADLVDKSQRFNEYDHTKTSHLHDHESSGVFTIRLVRIL